MPYCPKCGNEVSENMTFCPRCGASLKFTGQAPSAPPVAQQPPMRNEKSEKGEKHEQQPEKGEKHEKGELGYIGFLIAGLVVIIFGVFAYLNVTGVLSGGMQGALTLLIIGLAIIIAGIFIMTRRRNPPPP